MEANLGGEFLLVNRFLSTWLDFNLIHIVKNYDPDTYSMDEFRIRAGLISLTVVSQAFSKFFDIA
jgi:hypothetical protein